jgi:hypothetical protein
LIRQIGCRKPGAQMGVHAKTFRTAAGGHQDPINRRLLKRIHAPPLPMGKTRRESLI